MYPPQIAEYKGANLETIMKTRQEYEQFLKETVDPTINFREHPVNKDLVGIYYGDIYTETAIPNGVIYEEESDSYVDNFGTRHRGSNEATARVSAFIERFKSDPEFREYITAE